MTLLWLDDLVFTRARDVVSGVFATATWLAGWVAGWLSQPVL